MATTIVTKNSSTAAAVPTAAQLVQGELAVNVADKRLYTEDNGGAIVELGTNPSTIDINAGTIDGTTIGASSASTGAFTTLTATGAFTSRGIDDNADATAITIDSSENVGIGTSSPSSYFSPQLVVHSSVNLGGITIRSNATTDTNYLLFADGTSGNERYRGYVSYDHNTDTMKLATGASPAITIDSSQNVGIGTSSPSRKFSVLDTGSIPVRIETSTTDTKIEIITTSGTQFVQGSSNNLLLGTNGSERMRIDSSGNVGIGTSTNRLGERLTVNGNGIVTSSAENTNMGLFGTFGTSELLIGAFNDIPVVFRQNNTERMRIDSSGNVGIGVAGKASSTILKVENASGYAPTLVLNQSGIGAASIAVPASENVLQFNYFNGSSLAEAMRIDGSGNLLVGKTATAYGTAGVVAYANGGFTATKSADAPVGLNRLSSDGSIINFAKDGTTVGSIGTYSGTLAVNSVNTGIMLDDTNNVLRPTNASGGSRDAIISLGTSNQRFKDLYLSGGVYLGGTGATNKLDDYEEGIWTPSFTAQTTNPTVSYNTQLGYYTKIGNVVTAHLRIITTSASGGSGILQVSGLPFTVSGTHDGGGIISFNFNWASSQSPQQIVPQTSSNNAILYRDASTNLTSAPSHLLASGNSYLMATLIYRAA
jgi:hypothetical protein